MYSVSVATTSDGITFLGRLVYLREDFMDAATDSNVATISDGRLSWEPTGGDTGPLLRLNAANGLVPAVCLPFQGEYIVPIATLAFLLGGTGEAGRFYLDLQYNGLYFWESGAWRQVQGTGLAGAYQATPIVNPSAPQVVTYTAPAGWRIISASATMGDGTILCNDPSAPQTLTDTAHTVTFATGYYNGQTCTQRLVLGLAP